MVQRKAPTVGFGGAMANLPVWGAEKRRIKNREMGWALSLGGHQSLKTTNNQQMVGRSGKGDVLVEARGWASVWRDTSHRLGWLFKR
jgi:hypothetical protein